MKRRFLLQSILSFVLLLLIVIYAGRVLQERGTWALDLGGRGVSTLSPGTVTFFERLQKNLAITYFVSSSDKMPSHLKDLEREVRRFLQALQKVAPGRIDIRIIDPEVSGPGGMAYAARKKVSPVSVRHILRDAPSERAVWSSLVLAYGDYPEVLIQGIQSSHLPYLEDLVLQHLRALERPRRPIFAVAAPPSFKLLSDFLGEYGHVVEADLKRGDPIPQQADMLFWMQPSVASPVQVRQLQRFVASGRSAVLAASAYAVTCDFEGAEIRYRSHPKPAAWEGLLRSLGLRPLPDLLMDGNSGTLGVDGGKGEVRLVQAPFFIRCLSAFYNMKSFWGPARGALSFVAASALEIDPRRVTAAGWQAEVVGTTSADTWVRPLSADPFGAADLSPQFRVPKQNLMVLLKSADPWKGQILVLASSSPFRDGIINQEGYGHRLFLRNLARTFAAPERLVRNRVEQLKPAAIPPLSAEERLFWRFFAVLPVPLALLALGVWRNAGRGAVVAMRGSVAQPLARVGVALIAVAVGSQIWSDGRQLYLDLTADQGNRPAEFTLQVLEREHHDLEAEFIATSRASMPLGLKSVAARVSALLGHAEVKLGQVRPGHLSVQERRSLRDLGLAPFEVKRVLSDTLVSELVWSGLLLRRGDRTVVIPQLDQRTTDHLEFLLLGALQGLERGQAPHVAVVSDLPRLSPAEALEDYQKKGLLAPKGADVYSAAKALLQSYGYRVSHVDPKDPSLPTEVDVFLWLQPRRDSSRVIALLSGHLAAGGQAIVAMQHFNIQQRQYRGGGFRTVYWPQPQFQDFDRYLSLLGIEQVREILLDRTRHYLELETQVNRKTVREYDPQHVALPFLIRAVGEHFSSLSVITRRLGDLLFIWGNRFSLDRERLAAVGLSHQVLVATSPQAWSYKWKGGWLPPQVFAPTSYLSGPQPLSVLLQGRFGPIEFREEEGRATLHLQEAGASGPPGRLLLIGCSEMFKNPHLYAEAFQHDQLLLNSVALMAYGEEMAALQARRPPPRGFAFPCAGAKILWRLFVIGGAPLCILFCGLWRYGRRLQPLKSQ